MRVGVRVRRRPAAAPACRRRGSSRCARRAARAACRSSRRSAGGRASQSRAACAAGGWTACCLANCFLPCCTQAMLRGKVAVMWSDKAMGGASPPGMQLWVNGSQPRQVQLSTNSTVLARNLVAWSWGYDMFNYSWNKRELFDKVGLPVAHVFLDDAAATPETVQVFAAAAQEMRGKMAFVRLGRNDAFMLKDFGLPADSLPAFGIADAFDSKAKRYGMPDERLLPSPPKEIPDPSVSKPAEWNEEDDGEWEAPLVPNPEYTPSRRAARSSRRPPPRPRKRPARAARRSRGGRCRTRSTRAIRPPRRGSTRRACSSPSVARPRRRRSIRRTPAPRKTLCSTARSRRCPLPR